MDKVISVDFQDVRLDDAFRTLSQQVGVTIEVNWKSLGPSAITPGQTVMLQLKDLPAHTILSVLVEEVANLAPVIWAERDGRIIVADSATLRIPVVRAYNVADLIEEYDEFGSLFPPDEEEWRRRYGLTGWPTVTTEVRPSEATERLMSLLSSLVDADSWHNYGGSPGRVEYALNHLIVVQTPENQEKVRDLLRALRARDFTMLEQDSRRGATP